MLTTAIQKTLFAAGNDDLRPVMSGVFFQFAADSLTFVATDAHKLVRYRRTDLGSGTRSTGVVRCKANIFSR